MKDYRLYLPELTEYRAAQVKRRAEAFCDIPHYVLGTPIKPITPASFTRLLAAENRFICGGVAEIEDVWRFVWNHSPLYCPRAQWFFRLRKWVGLRRLRFQFNYPPSGHNKADWQRAVLVLATAEIRQIVNDTFADLPAKSARPGKQIATNEAFFIHEFSVAYNWTPERTRHTPIRKLLQLHRCIRSARGDDVSDDGEDNILAAHMDKMNAQLAAEREAKAKANA